jgi:polysaccharide deacetylase 2 family uncharacterized protein YibQ
MWAAGPGYASPKNPALPTISIVVDDLGYNQTRGNQVINLKGNVACSILPSAPHALSLARRAQIKNKDILLHLPMEPVGNQPMESGALRWDMSKNEMDFWLKKHLNALPNFIGVNNHMGSLLTQLKPQMHWVMQAIQNKGSLFFLDSRTTPNSVASETANELRLPTISRDVFLDNKKDLASIAKQFSKLVRIAKRNGHALAIAHPYNETIVFLEYWLPRLERRGVRLLPVSEQVNKKYQGRPLLWHASLSHSPRAVKN